MSDARVVPQKIIPWHVTRKRRFPEFVRTKPRAKKYKIVDHLRDPALKSVYYPKQENCRCPDRDENEQNCHPKQDRANGCRPLYVMSYVVRRQKSAATLSYAPYKGNVICTSAPVPVM